MMEKPMSLQVKETEEKVIKVFNESKLPAFALRLITQDLHQQLTNIEAEEIANYQKQSKEKKDSDI